MANISFKEALLISMQAAKEYVDGEISKVNNSLEDIDYNSLLAFDTNEIVFDSVTVSTASILGKARLHRLVLGNDGSSGTTE